MAAVRSIFGSYDGPERCGRVLALEIHSHAWITIHFAKKRGENVMEALDQHRVQDLGKALGKVAVEAEYMAWLGCKCFEKFEQPSDQPNKLGLPLDTEPT